MKNNIRTERVGLNLQVQELAERIGVSRQTIHSIENNRYVPSTILALKLSAVFGKTVNELFVLDPED